MVDAIIYGKSIDGWPDEVKTLLLKKSETEKPVKSFAAEILKNKIIVNRDADNEPYYILRSVYAFLLYIVRTGREATYLHMTTSLLGINRLYDKYQSKIVEETSVTDFLFSGMQYSKDYWDSEDGKEALNKYMQSPGELLI